MLPIQRMSLVPLWSGIGITVVNGILLLIAGLLNASNEQKQRETLNAHATEINRQEVAIEQIEDAVSRLSNVEIVKADVVAHMPGTDFDSWKGLNKREAPQVPADAEYYNLTDEGIIACSDDYSPVAAWSEIVGSWPDASIIYSVNAGVTSDGDITLGLRTRQGYSRGYAYVEVLVLCRGAQRSLR